MKEADIDEALDSQALFSRLLEGRLRNLDDDEILAAATTHWADFALEAEAVRITDQKERGLYHHWLTAVIEKPHAKTKPDPIVRKWIETILVSNAITFEKRAKTFREIHPLALQVILSSGMLNGIVVVRSVDSCAKLLHGLLLNSLSFDLQIDERNYRLIETITSSTIRVISRHRLLTNAFHSYFKPTG